MDVVEMQVMTAGSSNGAAHFSSGRVPTGNGGDVTVSIPQPSEGDRLLQNNTGESTPLNQGPSQHIPTSQEQSAVCRIKRELNEVAFWKVRVWMIAVCIFVVIIAVILISLVVCAALHEDEDEKYDPALFIVPLYHNGSFELPNQLFTEDLANIYSNKSQLLAAKLQKKIAGLYTSSPALGRFFSEASIDAFRNGSVVADYRLMFLMPEEDEDELRRFTLSRETVFNVFRQFLYDQEEEDRAQPLYIPPGSLHML